MKKNLIVNFLFVCLCLSASNFCHAVPANPNNFKLIDVYTHHCQQTYNINEHMPTLKMLAQECSSVVEIGVCNMFSTWGILQGLSESPYVKRRYTGIDIAQPPETLLGLAEALASDNGILFEFWHQNDMHVDIQPTDLLFIDSLHTYAQLTYELEKFSPQVKKYIAMHDTSAPWGDIDENYSGDYSEYPAFIDRNKRGLWPAVQDFLNNHPEWKLHARYFNNHGFTILKKVKNS